MLQTETLPAVSTSEAKTHHNHNNNSKKQQQQQQSAMQSSTPFSTTQQPFSAVSGQASSMLSSGMEQAQGSVERARQWLQGCIQNSADTLRVYVNRYPPLAAYLFTLMVLSAVPISMFLVYSLVSSSIILSVALVGFALVEGTILLVGGGLLMTVLGGIGLFTTIGFGIISFFYVGYRGFSMVFGRFWSGAGSLTESVQQGMSSIASSIPTPGVTITPTISTSK